MLRSFKSRIRLYSFRLIAGRDGLHNCVTAIAKAAFPVLFGVALVAAGAIFPTELNAQRRVVGRYQVDSWRDQDGVRLAFTSNVVETRDGYLWLSSQSGLTRFDGVRFTVFDGSNSPGLEGRPRLLTYPLFGDSEGALWVGSYGILKCLKGKVHLVSSDPTFQNDLVNAAAEENDGTTWTITRSGRVFRISRDATLQEIPGKLGYGGNMSKDPSGDIWIAGDKGALLRIHKGQSSIVKLPSRNSQDTPNRVLAARDNSIWYGTTTSVVHLIGGKSETVLLPPSTGLQGVSALAESSDGTIWVGTHGNGLYRYDGRHLVPFTRTDGLSDDRVIDIFVDHLENIWVATRDGLNRFRRLPFDVFTDRTGLPASLPGGMVRDISQNIWLAPPTGGLYHGKPYASQSNFVGIDGLLSDRIIAIASAKDGGVWIGQGAGVVLAVSATGRRKIVQSNLPPVTDILEDANGMLWIATWQGLFRVRNGKQRMFGASDGLPDDYVLRLFQDGSGRIWIATLTGVAQVVGPESEHFIGRRWPENHATRAVTFFEAPKGSVWIGSDEGLMRVTGDELAFVALSQGLPDNWVGAGEQDRAGYLWLGQLGGLTRLKVEELIKVADGRARSLTDVTAFQALDGLPGGDPASWPHPWSFQDESGKLWFAMGHGIVVVDPSKLAVESNNPTPHIDQITVDGVAVRGSEIALPYGARRLEIRYTGADLSEGPEVQFRYRLDGFDNSWVDARTQRTAPYTGLAPGHYLFRVIAKRRQGDWSPTEATLKVVVLAPFYRQSWFIVSACSLLILVLWATQRAWLRTRTTAIFDERSRLAREIHDSLLQEFGGIALHLHAATERLALPESQQQHLRRVLALIDRALTNARRVVWDLRQLEDASQSITSTYEEAARRIFSDTETQIIVTSKGTRRDLPLEIQVESLRIVDEALINTRLHARAKNVAINVQYEWSKVLVSVKDDGAGFDLPEAEHKPRHWGLKGMRERAGRINADISILSSPGHGTEVQLMIPIRRWFSSHMGGS